ncbi:dipeptidase [Garciella nitratireducens]|uniref:dipeptidase n=1 Tax=Garciella nitratireducens TaxID=218205 RepID=UPI000DEB7192|nr:dipeptidase [Garciella nitratireducens]RBP42259.1 membrane dipeptidase [Garciella nitratireducens]
MNIIDMHCDTMYKIYHEEEKSLRENSYSIDIQKLKKGNVIAQFFAMFIDKAWIDENHLDIYQHAKDFYRQVVSQLEANQEDIKQAVSYKELLENKKKGKISAFLTIEEGDFLQGKLERLEEFYHLGVRLITLTWNYENCIGYPNSFNREQMAKGLKPFGFEVIERMNELGMIIDVSHLSDGGFYDCIKHSKKPIVASHSCARSLVNVPRNMTDEMLKLLAEKGGMVGINFCPRFLGKEKDKVSRITYMLEHIQHIKKIAGMDAIGLGTDFDGIEGELEIKNIAQIHHLMQALEQAGFHPDEIEKICYKNVERILRECIG